MKEPEQLVYRILTHKKITEALSEILLSILHLGLTVSKSPFLMTLLYPLLRVFWRAIMGLSLHMGKLAQEKPIQCKVVKRGKILKVLSLGPFTTYLML